MLLRQIECFCAVARLGSFTKAAEECHVSQSAISQQVKALEADLDAQLIERHGRNFRLTTAGEVLARQGEDLLGGVNRLRRAVADAAYEGQRLSVGYLNRYEGWEVQSAVAAFALRHPSVKINARAESHDGLYRGILAGEFDILVNDRRRELSDEFENRLLFTAHDYIEVSEGCSVASASEVLLPQLRRIPCILVAQPDQQEIEAAYYRDVLGFQCEFIFAQTVEQAHMMAAGNQGFFPFESRNREAVHGSVLRRIPLVDANGVQRSHEYWAFWLKSRTNTLTEEFAGILQGMFG